MNKPIPCVGFELLYSPVDRNFLENIAKLVHNMSNRFIFDVEERLTKGQEILIVFSNKNCPTEHLYAEVKNCTKLADNHYVTTLETQPNAGIVVDSATLITVPINKGPSTAREFNLNCPSCKSDTSFKFIANQDGDWENGILPIYNCSACGTTRAMVGLVKKQK